MFEDECRTSSLGVPRNYVTYHITAVQFEVPQVPLIASSYLPRRRTLACQAHRILEALAEWGLAWQQRHLLDFHAACRAFHPIHLDVHGGAELAPRQTPHCPLMAIVNPSLPRIPAQSRSFLRTKRILLGHKKRPRWWPRGMVDFTSSPAPRKRSCH